ncbi:insulinase family protein [Pseudoalteromonas spongiae]|uniref:insulinase family protein n=1 Tax=Pseudoalteromonas spongiae TaxID=298657 RepID=UPI000C2CE906|nr:insulinase family protein [Pseudoalteromonas spongiae]
MITSSNDSRIYQSLKLDNGLKILVIEDAASDKSAASLTVNCGHFDDPISRQGLAHFLEHMLFLGSEKYPEPGSFSQFLSHHGGNCNAWTGTEHSSYFFEVLNEHFIQALSQFADIFHAPLILPSACEKERNAIDAEFKLKLKDDSRRIYQVHKETCNSAHPFAKFSVGNHQTLVNKNECISEEIRAFFLKHYQAQNMTLVISSNTPCELMKVKIAQLFNCLSGNPKREKTNIEAPLYLPENMCQSIYIEPHKHMQKLIVSFALPSIDNFYREKTVSFIAHLIGYEGVGSLYSVLKKAGWINGLSAGGGINGSNFKDFNISIALTDEGEKHKTAIVEYLFCYLQLIAKAETPLLERLYQDKKVLMDIAFNNQEKSRVLDWVNSLSVNMHHYPDEHLIYGDYIMTGFNRDQFDNVFTLLNANNMRLIHIHPDVPTDANAKWYGTPYSINKISQPWLDSLEKVDANAVELTLPTSNPYLTKPVVLHPIEHKHKTPEKRVSSDTFEFWYKQDSTFRVAKGHFYLALDSEITVQNVKNMAMTRLFADLFMDKVAEQFYPAELAGINYQLSAHQGGLTLHTWGLSGNQIELIGEILNELLICKFDSIRFYEYQRQLVRHWQNGNQSKPVSLLFSELSATLLPWNPTPLKLAEAIEQISFCEFNAFCSQLFEALHCQILMHGNWTPLEADDCVALIREKLKTRTTIADLNRPIVTLDNKQEQTHDVPHPDNALVSYFQASSDSISEKIRLMALNHLISQDYFHDMRTEKQLGYLVGSGFAPLNNRAGIAFYIQSPEIASDILAQHSNHFLANYHQKINAMSDEDWQQAKQALMMQIVEKDKNLRLKSQRFWLAIGNGDGQFNMQYQLKTALLQLSKAQLVSYSKRLFSENSTRLELKTKEKAAKQATSSQSVKQALTP